MRFIKNFLLCVFLLFLTPNQVDAQWGWQSGQYYQYEGRWVKEYDQYYVRYFQNGYEKRYRILQWERRYCSGYVYVWNGFGWVYKWQNSWAWYCRWSGWNYEFYMY